MRLCLTNNLLFYAQAACPIKVYLQISFGRGLCRVETSQLISKANSLTSFCMVWAFSEGYFRTDYSTISFSEAAIKKFLFILIPVAGSLLVGLQTTCHLQFYLRMTTFAVVLMFSVCIYFTGASFDDCFPRVHFLENLPSKCNGFGSFSQIFHTLYET